MADYIGLPFAEKGRDRDGVDCWGLVRLVIAERAGLDLPSYLAGYEGTSRADGADIQRLIDGGTADWVEVPAAARALDVVVLRAWGAAMHVGVVVAPGWMLHVEAGADAALARYDGQAWRNRVVAIYRHRNLLGDPS